MPPPPGLYRISPKRLWLIFYVSCPTPNPRSFRLSTFFTHVCFLTRMDCGGGNVFTQVSIGAPIAAVYISCFLPPPSEVSGSAFVPGSEVVLGSLPSSGEILHGGGGEGGKKHETLYNISGLFRAIVIKRP